MARRSRASRAEGENLTPGAEGQPEEHLKQIWEEVIAMIRGTHPRCRGNPQYLIGIQPGYGPKYIPVRDLYHVLVTGLTGCGKSVFLLSQILQDVYRGNSVFVFDPHGDLAELILTHVPRERWDDVVYINPLTARDFGRVVRYNFLEVKEGQLPSIVKRSFMDALQKNYPEFWGPRLDAIIDHSISLLQKTPGVVPTLPKLGKILAKESYREALLAECRDESVSDFWHFTFPKYQDDAITAAQNKLYRILEEELVTPITSAEHSTVDFGALMQEGKIVIFDIREGVLTSSLSSFIGTLFLARIYQAGMAREKLPESERRYCRVYVDEASRFLTSVLKENMQALRKYNVFLTVVCQNLDQFSEGIKSEGGISQYTSTVVAFQSSQETAKSLEGFFPRLPQPARSYLQQTKFHSFYISVVVGTRRENYYIQSIDPGRGENQPEEVIKHSLERYGERYDFQTKRVVLELPPFEFGPAAYFALSELEQRGEMSEEALQEKLGKFSKAAVRDALFRTLYDRGWATYEWREGPAKTRQRFWRITDVGLEVLYPTTSIAGNRLGGAKHIAMLCVACKLYRELGFYPMIITGKREYDTVTIREGQKKVDIYPDIILFSPYPETTTRHNPTSWDVSRAIAVEIEAYPTGGKHTGAHLDRTRAHFVKARDILEMPVIFVVHTEREAEAVRREIEKEGAKIVPDIKSHYVVGAAAVRTLEKILDEVPNSSPALAAQIRKLCSISRQADISEVAEPEDFIEERTPDYASHRWYEMMRKEENEAKVPKAREERVIEVLPVEAGQPPRLESGAEAAQEQRREEKAGGQVDETMEELKKVRRQKIEPLLKEGYVLWVEEIKGFPHLFAGKVLDTGPKRVHVDFFDDAAKWVLMDLGAFPYAECPERFRASPKVEVARKSNEDKAEPEKKENEDLARAQPIETIDLRTKVLEFKNKSARWILKNVKGKKYLYARLGSGAERQEKSLGVFDENLQNICKELGIYLG